MLIVYARRDDLLGGCLMNLAHSWGFSRKLGRQFMLNWLDYHPSRPHMPISDILQSDLPFALVSIAAVDIPGAYAMPRVPQWSNALATYPAIFYPHTSWVQVDGASKSDDEPRIRALLNSLPIQPAVAWAVEAIAARHPNFTAVHLRRGDDILAILRSDDRTERYDRACSSFVKRCLDLETYRLAIKANSDGSLLIFSNDTDAAERLQGLLPGRRIALVSEQPELLNLTPTQRDFAEMLLMARAARIIGTRSNFSAFPRLLGGCPLILAHRYISQPHLREFVESTVPTRALPQVIAGYNKILNHQALK